MQITWKTSITILLTILTFCLGGFFLVNSIYQGWLSSFPEIAPDRAEALQLSSTIFFFSGLALIIGSPVMGIYLSKKKIKAPPPH